MSAVAAKFHPPKVYFNQMRIVELDFGMGNIRSLQKAFEHCGAQVDVSSDPFTIVGADALLLPGDGAFGKAIQELRQRQLLEPIKDFVASGRPVLGICIGFQLLFEKSHEFGTHTGLNLLKGEISRFDAASLVIPHMGWARTQLNTNSRLLKGLPTEAFFYYVHSYRLPGIHPAAIGTCDYGGIFTSVVEQNNLYGVQFHPEKSQHWGLAIIRNFLNLVQDG